MAPADHNFGFAPAVQFQFSATAQYSFRFAPGDVYQNNPNIWLRCSGSNGNRKRFFKTLWWYDTTRVLLLFLMPTLHRVSVAYNHLLCPFVILVSFVIRVQSSAVWYVVSNNLPMRIEAIIIDLIILKANPSLSTNISWKGRSNQYQTSPSSHNKPISKCESAPHA